MGGADVLSFKRVTERAICSFLLFWEGRRAPLLLAEGAGLGVFPSLRSHLG